MALKYLKDTETNISNIIIITGDFNIKDSLWDSNFPFHSVHSDMLFNIADCYRTLWTLTIFIFLFFIFLILYQFYFTFLLILDNEEAYDTAVT